MCVCFLCVYVCVCVYGQPEGANQPAKPGKGYLVICLPEPCRSVVLQSEACGSGILFYFERFRSVLVSRVKTQTRRMWSDRTPAAGRYLCRMRKTYEEGLFVRAWCGGKLIGWVLLTGWDSEPLGDMKEGDLVKELRGNDPSNIC